MNRPASRLRLHFCLPHIYNILLIYGILSLFSFFFFPKFPLYLSLVLFYCLLNFMKRILKFMQSAYHPIGKGITTIVELNNRFLSIWRFLHLFVFDIFCLKPDLFLSNSGQVPYIPDFQWKLSFQKYDTNATLFLI